MKKPDRIKVLSYNIHKGFSLSRRFILESLKDSVQKTGANLVFLQEVQGNNKNMKQKSSTAPFTGQLEFLADKMWPHYAYGRNAIYEDGDHGNGIMSEHPLVMVENIDISNNRFERRGLLHAVMNFKEKFPVHLICVHLDLLDTGRNQQILRIIDRLITHVPREAPLILAGDFNDWSEKATDRLQSKLSLDEVFLVQEGRHAKSYPAAFPFLPLDRIYFRGLHPLKAQCLKGKPWSELSDHNALYAEFELEIPS
jgi:endonuclease/exonuclease/phosphatase family metal-dependent hydrolase